MSWLRGLDPHEVLQAFDFLGLDLDPALAFWATLEVANTNLLSTDYERPGIGVGQPLVHGCRRNGKPLSRLDRRQKVVFHRRRGLTSLQYEVWHTPRRVRDGGPASFKGSSGSASSCRQHPWENRTKSATVLAFVNAILLRNFAVSWLLSSMQR